MTRIRWALALVLVLSTSATAFAATYQLDNEDMEYDSRKPGFAVDSDGNIHTANRGYWDGGPVGWGDDYNLVYHMVESATGDELIDDTWLTVGDEQARVQFIWLADGKLGVLYHESVDEIFFAVLDPSLHDQDGTDANATATTPVADGGNTGNGTMSAVQTGAAVTQTESWTVEYDGTEWTVTGSVCGELATTLNAIDGDYLPDENGEATPVAFTLTNGGTGFASGDKFTFSTTASPILVEPATSISGTGSGYSHAARAALTADDRLYVVWRTGAYETDNSELNSRVVTPGGSMEAIDQIDAFGSAERFSDYG
ncbi:MAG: hypothetical protein KJ042_04625, partial [Deltaproteobacteria bacterium]|nr:hypothetical protein [Deltaproteobacteria bacterium]